MNKFLWFLVTGEASSVGRRMFNRLIKDGSEVRVIDFLVRLRNLVVG